MNRQRHFKKRLNQNQQIDLNENGCNGGLICDLSVTLKASTVPVSDGITHSKNPKNSKRVPPSYSELKKYLQDSLKCLSKDELTDYVLKLILNCPHESVEVRSCCEEGGSIANSAPHDSIQSFPQPKEIFRRHIRESTTSGNKRRHMKKTQDDECVIDNSNNHQGRGTPEQFYFNKIVSAIDLLCDMRSLFDQTLTESIGRDKSPQNTDRNSNRRCAAVELDKENYIMKCNKRVQTEACQMYTIPEYEANYQDFDSSKREEQRNPYSRFQDYDSYRQAPIPLTPPMFNLRTYKKYNRDTC